MLPIVKWVDITFLHPGMAPMPDLPAGTVTLLFTDIEGSTRLLQVLGDAYPAVLAEEQALLRAAFAAHNGAEVDSQGDSFFAVFERATEALAAAVAAQQGLANHSWPAAILKDAGEGPAGVRVRMGIHTGEPLLTESGYVGLDVHRAARIGAVAHGGQIVISQATASLVSQRLPDGTALRDLGEHRLRDLRDSEHLFQVDISGLPATFPPIRSLDSRPNNLPTAPAPLLGRDQEVASLLTLLRQEGSRLVTLTGPGGTGKTRLGLHLATELLQDFPDGVFFVGLAPISDPALIAPAIVHHLGLHQAAPRSPEENLTNLLRDKRLLLLLDNFEQILEGAPLLARLLAACPGLHVLVTSRAPLRLTGEHEFPVAPLALPPAGGRTPSAGDLLRYPAVSLFVERARMVRPDFVVSAENAAAVAAICARLDGLPLAIELAAARLRHVSPQVLLEQLEHGLSVLSGGARDLPLRHQTLRDTIAWSYDLLDPDERTLFRRLSVFVGGAPFDAIEPICRQRLESPKEQLELFDAGFQDSAGPAPDALSILASLIDKSLLQPDESLTGQNRFRMLETVREFALEQLTRHAEAGTLQRRHAEYYVDLAEEAEQTLMSPADRTAWFARLDAEQHNLRAAVRWALDHQEAGLGMRLVGAVWLWLRRELIGEGLQWIEKLLALPDAASRTPARAKALFVAGELAWANEDYRAAELRLNESVDLWRSLGERRWLALALAHQARATTTRVDAGNLAANLAGAQVLGGEGVAIAREIEDPWILAWVLIRLADVTSRLGDSATARKLAEESARLARSLGDRWLLARPVYLLGRIAFEQEDWIAARAHLEEALPARRTAHDKLNISYVLTLLGDIALRLGEPERAATLAAESLRIAWEIENHMTIAHDLSLLARTSAAIGQPAQTATLLAAAEQLRQTARAVLIPRSLAEHELLLCAMQTRLTQPDVQDAWAKGWAMDLGEAVATGIRVAEMSR